MSSKTSLIQVAIVSALLILSAACAPGETAEPTDVPAVPPTQAQEEPTQEVPAPDPQSAVDALQDAGCGACHVIPGVPNAQGTLGPDLSEIASVAEDRIESGEYRGSSQSATEYIRESLLDPNAFIAPECPNGHCPEGLMPATPPEESNLEAMVEYLAALPEGAAAIVGPDDEAVVGAGPELSSEEFDVAKQVFFDRCAGCHGVLRNGATGPALTPDVMQPKGTAALAAIIFNGTPRGMPDWGKQGVLSEAEAELMAKYIQNEPPEPPEMSLEKMLSTWNLLIPVDERPTEPQHDRDWQDFFSVTLRDAGQVAIIDGDTYEVVNIVDTGFAVHISRMSATGRYIYTIGRDGKATMIDTWMEVPDKVAEAQVCFDARSIEVSKYVGEEGDFSDTYAVVGCYWPPHFVILDGLTLEPFKIISTRSYTYDTEEFHPEPRVASIVASHFKPEWIINVKETGQIWLVNYSDPINPTIKMIESERFLHDGGWDSTKRYFLVAANNANKVAVVDALEGELEALVDTPERPHPGRGANWIDPEFGPVWSTSHLGEGKLIAIGTDPEGHPEHAWQVVRTVQLLGGGGLFVKTHPNSEWIWADHVLNSDETIQRSICVIAKSDPTETYRCWEAADYGRAVHFDYNKEGTEVWVSIWGRADVPGETGEIVIYDDKTLEEIARIPDLVTPTGKFNVYNTVNDVY